MIYTKKQIEKNWLYASVMEEINELYIRHGEPEEFDTGENRRTTTGSARDEFWNAREIGEWENPDEVAAEANAMLDTVYSGLGLGGNVKHYYTSDKWDAFVMEAELIIDEWHTYGAFQHLCDNA